MLTSRVQLPLAPAVPMRQLAARHQIRVGASVDEAAFQRDSRYREVLAGEFSILTPENVLKFECVHPAPDRYDFRPADALIFEPDFQPKPAYRALADRLRGRC